MTETKIDLKAALREAFGKCPEHDVPVIVGHWLKWCPKKECSWLGVK